MTRVPGPRSARFTRPVAVVPLVELHGPRNGVVGPVPGHLFWSGERPQDVTWDLDDPAARRLFYEIVLAEGGADDVRRCLDGDLLVELWPQLYLPPHVRQAWSDQLDRPAGP